MKKIVQITCVFIFVFLFLYHKKNVFAECASGTSLPCINYDDYSQNICKEVRIAPTQIVGATTEQVASFSNSSFEENARINPDLLRNLNYFSIEEWRQHLNQIPPVVNFEISYDKNSTYLDATYTNTICGGIDDVLCDSTKSSLSYFFSIPNGITINDEKITLVIPFFSRNTLFQVDYLKPGPHILKLYYQRNQNIPICQIYFNVESNEALPTPIPTTAPTPTPMPSRIFSNCQYTLFPQHINTIEETANLSFNISAETSLDQNTPPFINIFYKNTRNGYSTLKTKASIPWTANRTSSSPRQTFTSSFTLQNLIDGNSISANPFNYADSYTIKIDIADSARASFFECDVREFTLIKAQPTLTPTPTPLSSEDQAKQDAKKNLKKVCDILPHDIYEEKDGEKTEKILTAVTDGQRTTYSNCLKCVNPVKMVNDIEEPDLSKSPGSFTAIGCLPTDLPSFIKDYVWKYGLGLAGGVSFLLALWAAFNIIISGGDAKKIAQNQELIVSAVTGLLFIIFSVLILRIIGVDVLKIPGFSG